MGRKTRTAYHDLNVQVAAERREAALEELQGLGYGVVAFTTTYEHKTQLSAADVPAALPRVWAGEGGRGRGLTVLSRAHVVVRDAAELGVLQSPQLGAFDVVSVCPASEKLLHQCLQADVDVVALDLAARRPLHVKRQHANVAAEKGVVFELSYATLLRERAARRAVVANAAALARLTNVAVASGARKLIELRGAHDVANLATVFGLQADAARSAVVDTPAQIVRRADVRRNTTKGIVRVVDPDVVMQDA